VRVRRAKDEGRRAKGEVNQRFAPKAETLKGWKAERKIAPAACAPHVPSLACLTTLPLRTYALDRWSDLGPLATSLKKAKLPPYETCFFRGPTSLPAWGFSFFLALIADPTSEQRAANSDQRPANSEQRTANKRISE
jgi:hypothetical protein